MQLTALFLAIASASLAFAQNCGPKYGNKICAAGTCCSQYGWCANDVAHCDPKTCIPKYSGSGSSCAKLGQPSSSSFSGPYASQVPDIDVCGSASNGVSCPGAGINGYFYRCCSSHGHCGPKNNIQDQGLYCGVQEAGCQSAYGSCQTGVTIPPNPKSTPGVAQNGQTCGPIVNKKCAAGLCCSGSNFCGTGADFCGSANWCQPSWGQCSQEGVVSGASSPDYCP